jgi:glycosyltransferase involved in cell wall biosynthesis
MIQKTGKIKILRIISRMNIGGPSIHVKNLTEKLNSNRFTTRLITGSVSPNEGDMGYIVKFNDQIKIFIPELQREISPYRDIKALIKIIKEIIRFNPHIIHSHTSKAGTIARAAAFICNVFRRNKIITVHTFHGNVLDGYFSRFKSTLILWIERLMAKLTDAIIAISTTQKWELSNVYKIERPNKINTIKLGFDLNPFQTAHRLKGKMRQKYGISEDEVLIGMVGRMVPIKNHKMFLDAGRTFADRQNIRKVKFFIVGDGEKRQFLEDYTLRLGIKDKVIFTGWERDLAQVYADLDMLALTSLNEGTPVSVIEAMAASVPVITTGVGGIKDLLGKNQADQPDHSTFIICERGILCPKNNPSAFSNALTYMFDSGYLEDKERFRKASEYVVENYSIERLVNDIGSLYENLLASEQAISISQSA